MSESDPSPHDSKLFKDCFAKCADVKLPTGTEFHYNSSFAAFSEPLLQTQCSLQQTLSACAAVLKLSGKGKRLQTASSSEQIPDWKDPEELLSWTTSLLDDALEEVDLSLMAHRTAAAAAADGTTAASSMPTGTSGTGATQVAGQDASKLNGGRKGPVRHAVGLARPQDSFRIQVDNSNTPFRLPRILSSSSHHIQSAEVHPLEQKLNNLHYKDWQLQAKDSIPPRCLEETPLTFVDTVSSLKQMVLELEGCAHIAIDLENHSFRSFQGFTCLMQLSSRERDYVIDTLALRDELGNGLAELFEDPDVVKVLHGADRDIEWLQRDFGLYVVNMFDTGQAARVLSLSSFSLAFLLEHFCGFKADKRYQLADWRVRPLSSEMLHYARCDTHYLLYIYDRLKQLLLEAGDKVPPALHVEIPESSGGSGAMGCVLERSRQLCLQPYRKELLTPDAALESAAKWSLRLTPEQCGVFCKLFEWRDSVCREEDESTGYVLPKAQLSLLSHEQPTTLKDLKRVLGRNLSEVFSRRASEVLAAIAFGRKEPRQPLPPKDETTGGKALPVGSGAIDSAPDGACYDGNETVQTSRKGGLPFGDSGPLVTPGASESTGAADQGLPSLNTARGGFQVADAAVEVTGTAATSSGFGAQQPKGKFGELRPKVLSPLVPRALQQTPSGSSASLGGTGTAGLRVSGPRTGGMASMMGRALSTSQKVQKKVDVLDGVMGHMPHHAGVRQAPTSTDGLLEGLAVFSTSVTQPSADDTVGSPHSGSLLQAQQQPVASKMGNVDTSSLNASLHEERDVKSPKTSDLAPINRPRGSSMASMLGGSRPASSMSSLLMSSRPDASSLLPRQHPSSGVLLSGVTSHECSEAKPSNSVEASLGSKGVDEGEEEELERVKRVRASFTLPFVSRPAQGDTPLPVTKVSEGIKGIDVHHAEDSGAVGDELRRPRETVQGAGAAEIRSVMDGLIHGGGLREIMLGEEGKEAVKDVDMPLAGVASSWDTEEEGGVSRAGGEMEAPDDEGDEDLEYVPLPLSKIKQIEKRGRNKDSLRDPSKSQAMKDMLKMKYVMGVEISHAEGSLEEDNEAGSSDDEAEGECGSGSEGGNQEAIFGDMAKKRRRREYEAARRQQRKKSEDNAPASSAAGGIRSDVIPYDYEQAAANARRCRLSELDGVHDSVAGGSTQRAGQGGRGRTCRRDHRGGSRQAGGRGRERMNSSKSGTSHPSSSKELRGGKRSALTPASGNRTSTFK
ncbi:hypothetical protein CEUSTIGMA_g11191.t1 [Chlamydomonas eustigma]|uniref:HRDC domain-containing protein n=1 Tax=Chlamydomonas eustigma TaxID=1157962 RepID=A0A250XL59_9CHLO|nr:hypothetical protein CEUSTIGMA_g11191.t1 [Chlamydomonas eustigma]|eukprot:GAX83766.1 hypothetical protein CEUSTIGMA_g11191.t1 [Chlamydomonas eustigma]